MNSNLVKLFSPSIPFATQNQSRRVSKERIFISQNFFFFSFEAEIVAHVVTLFVRKFSLDERKDSSINVWVLRVELANGQLIIALLDE